MAETEPENTKKAPKAPTEKKASKKLSSLFLGFLFVITLALAALTVYIAQQGLLLKDDVSKLQTELSQLRLLDQQPIIQNLMQEINTQNLSQQNFAEEINQRFDTWQKFYDEKQSTADRKKDDWVLNEVAYLMRIASTRLYLANDITSSISALTQADLRIGELQNPTYLPIRKTLGEEISALQNLKQPDVDGVALQIERAMNDVSLLPKSLLKSNDNSNFQTSIDTDNLLSQILNTIGIKKNTNPVSTISAQQNALFLDQLLRLELESAKQSLIRYKKEEFIRHINRSKSLIEKHYKQSDTNVVNLLSKLNSIIDLQIFPELPDITKSLNLLQSILNRYQEPTNNKQDVIILDKDDKQAT